MNALCLYVVCKPEKENKQCADFLIILIIECNVQPINITQWPLWPQIELIKKLII